MKSLKFLLLSTLCFCFELVAQAQFDNPEIVYKDNREIQCYQTENVILVAWFDNSAPIVGFKHNPVFNVNIQYIGDSYLDVNPDRIVATLTNSMYSQNIEVYTLNKVKSKALNKTYWFGPGNYAQNTIKTSVTNKDGNGNTTSTTEGETKSTVYTGAYSEAVRDAKDYLNSYYLKRNTIESNDELNGIVILQKARSGKLTLEFTLGNETFTFYCNLDEMYK